MKLHYKGPYNSDPASLPHGEHKPNAVPFREAKDMKTLSQITNIGGFVLTLLLAVPVLIRCWAYINTIHFAAGCLAALLALFPHELLHAVCFKQDVYLYTNRKQGLLFVVGPEPMSKRRFILMCLLPNLLLGFLPYIVGLSFPQLVFLAAFGTTCIGSGFGDYYNIINALTQMPKGAKTYLYQMHSFWYLPE
ncbi:MAG: DUF3267 domain-containing protein [Clostridiales bacterium]|nr:DUF3267 domain-containing protein [Clostridiales bacterium]